MRPCRVASLVILSLLAGSPAHAQLGGLMKKAQKAVEKKTEGKAVEQMGGSSGGYASKPDGAPATEAVVRGMIAALTESRGKLEERDRLAEQVRTLQDRQQKILGPKGQDALDRYDQQTDKVNECIRDEFKKYVEGKQAEIIAKGTMNMPTAREAQQMVEDGKLVQAAAMRNDTATVNRITIKLRNAEMKRVGIDWVRDSTAAAAKCPAYPKQEAWMIEYHANDAKINALTSDQRNLEHEAAKIIEQKTGLTGRDVGLMREKMQLWMDARMENPGAVVRGVTREEADALELVLRSYRKDQLKKLLDVSM
ncbi:MAG: hypothetical protein JWO05_2724 [Gemmatimonadetes bacterium]|nr:hypothetical protein [Gemmatimonadota bacterium]